MPLSIPSSLRQLPISLPSEISFVAAAVCTLVLASAVHFAFKYYQKWSQGWTRKAFRFMALPPELRDNIYEYLLEPPAPKLILGRSIDWYKSAEWVFVNIMHMHKKMLPYIIGVPKQPQLKYHHLNTLALVSKKFGAESMSVYANQALIDFTLDASSEAAHPFEMATSSLVKVRHCNLRILASSEIANAFDPREAKSSDWALRRNVFAAMKQMSSLQSMSLTIEAKGGHLWNPISLWHFIAQAFKVSDVKAFNRINFTMAGWKLREPNHLAREERGEHWEWRCKDGHLVVEDDKGEQAVRNFAYSLYADCQICEAGDATDTEADESGEGED